MIEIKIGSDTLDLYANTGIEYTLNNAVFTSADTSTLPGSYSFPISIPATGTNLRLLKYPTMVNSSEKYVPKQADIYMYGIRLFTGLLKIETADEKSISVYIVASGLSDLKEIKLPELDFGGDREIGNQAAMLAHAKATTVTPLDYDYIFFPVVNRNFIPGKKPWYYQNDWDYSTQQFKVSADNPLLMPFIRLEYLLDKVFAKTGYTFKNEFQTTAELRSIVLHSLYSLYNRNAMSTFISLKDHVPDITCADIVKRVASRFCLGLFPNIFSKSLRLIPLQRVLSAPPTQDWTDKVHRAYTITYQDTDIPAAFKTAEDSADKVFAFLAQLTKPTTYTTIQNVDDILGEPYGDYYVIAAGEYWRSSILRQYMIYKDFGKAPDTLDKPVVDLDLTPLMDLHDFYNTANYTNTQLPNIDQAGTVTYQDGVDEDTNPVFVEQKNAQPVRISIYRGMVYDGQANTYPLGSGIRYGPLGQVLGDYSLRIDGPDGIYEKWWSRWHNMLYSGKRVTMRVNLSLSDLVAFEFDQKVRIDNMDYFITSMKVQMTMQGLKATEVEMVSVI